MDSFGTARLSAERLHEAHLADLVAFHLDPDVSRYLGGVRSPQTTRAYLTTNLAHWDSHGFGLWALRTEDGAFCGRAGLRHMDLEGVDEVEIAYALTPRCWGRGLATEIALALTAIAFERLRQPSLVGVVALDNDASRHVLEKAGFAFERKAVSHGVLCTVHRLFRVPEGHQNAPLA